MNVTSTPAPKWLNMCWDSFRHVDNHNKSHIFQPRLQRPLHSISKGNTNGSSSASRNTNSKRRSGRAVPPQARGGADDEERCISIEIVREKLKGNSFKNIEEFDDEMQTLFQTWF